MYRALPLVNMDDVKVQMDDPSDETPGDDSNDVDVFCLFIQYNKSNSTKQWAFGWG
jgi:hypothetical protein